jgi:PPOX class probable F420-dependent enzyme
MVRLERAELQEHRKVISDRPPLGDATVHQPVREHGVACVGTSRRVEAAEGPSGPVMLTRSELDDQIAFGHDVRFEPAGRMHVAAGVLEELAGTGDPIGAAEGEGVVLHARGAQLVQSAEVTSAVSEVVELGHDGLVVVGVHGVSLADERRPCVREPRGWTGIRSPGVLVKNLWVRGVGMGELTMTRSDREAFLADLHVGVITVARDGEAPLAAPVWYSYEPGGDVVFDFESASEKIKLLDRSGQASLCVQSEAMPYKYVTVEGPTTVGDVDDDVQRALAHRYLGTEIGDMYLHEVAESVSLVVHLTPTRWRTQDYTAMVERVVGA